jgi:hypothetical protein
METYNLKESTKFELELFEEEEKAINKEFNFKGDEDE